METLAIGVDGTTGETIDSAFEASLTKKRNKLLDKIAKYEGNLSSEEIKNINSVQFILEFVKTLDVIDCCERDEKVNYIASLFGKYFLKEHHEHANRYEEYLNQLSTLSYREIEIMVALYQLEEEHKEMLTKEEKDENELQRSIFCTKKLQEMAFEKCEVLDTEMLGILTSLCRSGFIREVTGSYIGYDGGAFCTTDYFKGFLHYILD